MKLPEARERLSDDHQAVSEVLMQLLTALNNKDVQASHVKLDLLWARLAVHIRAEHLHLFPAVISRLTETGEYLEAPTTIERLREDHDFFMHELAQAIGVVRELAKSMDKTANEAGLAVVGDAVREVEKRLVAHNDIEENQIYSWASKILTQSERIELATRIDAEFKNRPPRFSVEAWTNE